MLCKVQTHPTYALTISHMCSCIAGEDVQWCAAEGSRPEPQSPLWRRLSQSELAIFGQNTVMYDICRRPHKRRVISITSCWSTATSSSTTWRTGWRRWTPSDSRSGTPRHLLSSKEYLSSESWGQMSCWIWDSFDIESDGRRHAQKSWHYLRLVQRC